MKRLLCLVLFVLSCALGVVAQNRVIATKDEVSYLHAAAFQGRLDWIQEFIESHPKAIDLPDEQGYTALFAAIAGQHLLVTKYLLDHGANIDSETNTQGLTPLVYAAVYNGGCQQLVRMLLGRRKDHSVFGLNRRYRRFDNATVLLIAIDQTSNLDVVELLVEAGADPLLRDDYFKMNAYEKAQSLRDRDPGHLTIATYMEIIQAERKPKSKE